MRAVLLKSTSIRAHMRLWGCRHAVALLFLEDELARCASTRYEGTLCTWICRRAVVCPSLKVSLRAVLLKNTSARCAYERLRKHMAYMTITLHPSPSLVISSEY
jgi:hypothetical protein